MKSRLSHLGIYAALVATFVATTAAVIHFGPPGHAGLVKAVHGERTISAAGLNTPLAQALMQLLVVVVAARVVGALFTRMSQPAVIGEMAVGIALGPSLLGKFFPSIQTFIFPASSLGTLSMLSQVGIVLFMFIVGMELDLAQMKQKAGAAIMISHASIIVPFLMGLVSAIWLYKDYGADSFTAFALFMGISMSITAFPVLARIIQERGLSGTELGNTSLTCAAIDDLTAWIGLAFIVALAGNHSLNGAIITLVASTAFFVFVMGVLRPWLQQIVDRLPDPSSAGKNATVLMLVTVFACSLFTEMIGLHALFGAFVAGMAMPRDEKFRAFLTHRLEYFSSLFLLPVFFAFTGLRTQVGLLGGTHDWLICGLLLVIAIVGKFGGSAGAARITGMSWRDSAAIGALMNSRGLVELIVLNLGLDLGVLSPKIFAMLILMAIVTTFSTGPVITTLGLGTQAGERASERASADSGMAVGQ